MGKDMEPMTRAHLTPSLLTMGPPKKQAKLLANRTFHMRKYVLVASMAYVRAVAILDTRGVARPPPPRPIIFALAGGIRKVSNDIYLQSHLPWLDRRRPGCSAGSSASDCVAILVSIGAWKSLQWWPFHGQEDQRLQSLSRPLWINGYCKNVEYVQL